MKDQTGRTEILFPAGVNPSQQAATVPPGIEAAMEVYRQAQVYNERHQLYSAAMESSAQFYCSASCSRQ